MSVHLLDSSSLSFASISLLGGYLGKLEGSQACGFVVKNCQETSASRQHATSNTAHYMIINKEQKADCIPLEKHLDNLPFQIM